MKYWFWCFAAGIFLVSAAGCYFQQYTNVENAKNLRVDMSKEEVLAIMGEPVEVELSSPDLWFYFIRSYWHDGMITEDECMPVVFENDCVVGWGNHFYATYRLEERNFYKPQAFKEIPLPEDNGEVQDIAGKVAEKEADGKFTVPGERAE